MASRSTTSRRARSTPPSTSSRRSARRSRSWASFNSRGRLRVPAPALLADETVLLEAGEHPVQVVLLDPHLLRELGDGDAGLRADQVEGLVGARAGALGAPALARAATAALGRGAARRRGGGGAECAQRTVQALVLLERRP